MKVISITKKWIFEKWNVLHSFYSVNKTFIIIYENYNENNSDFIPFILSFDLNEWISLVDLKFMFHFLVCKKKITKIIFETKKERKLKRIKMYYNL